MYSHRDQSYSGDRRGDRHQHHRGSTSSHSTRDRSKKHRESSRRERDHGGHSHRGSSSRRVSSGGGGGSEVSGESEVSSRRSSSGAGDHSGRRSSRDVSHNSRSGNKTSSHVEGHSSSSSRSSRTSLSRVSSIDELTGGSSSRGGGAAIDLPPETPGSSGTGSGDSSAQTTKKTTQESGSASKSFGGFILHEAISPPSEDFEGSFRAGGFDIRVPVVTRSSSDESIENDVSGGVKKGVELWGAMVDAKTTPSGDVPPKVPLWEKDWRPGPLTCSVPKSADTSTSWRPAGQGVNKSGTSSVLDYPRDKHGRNPLLHCIDLQRYIHDTRLLLHTLSADQDKDQVEVVPEKPHKYYSPRAAGSKVLSCDKITKLPSVNLTQQGLSQSLKKSAAAISLFSGFEWSSPDALNLLSDVMGRFLSNFSQLLRMNADRCKEGSGCCGFQDALERSLHETGMHGKEGLFSYWKEEVEAQGRLLDAEADETRNKCLRIVVTEEQPRTSKPPALSSPFSHSQIFAQDDEDSIEEVEMEEVSLDTALQETRDQARANGNDMSSALSSPDIAPPDYPEGFSPLELEGPPRKRLRTGP